MCRIGLVAFIAAASIACSAESTAPPPELACGQASSLFEFLSFEQSRSAIAEPGRIQARTLAADDAVVEQLRRRLAAEKLRFAELKRRLAAQPGASEKVRCSSVQP